jgi:hypothetical protein
VVAIVLAAGQANFYFRTYGALDAWFSPTIQGEAVADQGTGALVVTLGRQYHQVNSGWVRLLAPAALRGAMRSPGIDLPLGETGGRDLAFLLYPDQEPYLGLLRQLYPGGTIRRYTHPDAGLVVSVYRVGRAAAVRRRGALARAGSGRWEPVETIGDVPASVTRFPARLRWSGLLRVSGDGQLRLRLSGRGTLMLDGRTVLATTHDAQEAAVLLARGAHLIRLDGIVPSLEARPRVEWRLGGAAWRPIVDTDLIRGSAARGLLGVVTAPGLGAERRLGTLADCCLAEEVGTIGAPIRARWRGSLNAPRTGRYGMSLLAEGDVRLLIDGRTVLHQFALPRPAPARTTISLRRGRHSVLVLYRTDGSAGGIEWTWTPPGARESVVPADALLPPAGAGPGLRRPAWLPPPPPVLEVKD